MKTMLLIWGNNYKLNLYISPPLSFINKLTNDKLDLDITKLKTDIVIPKQNEGSLLNHDGTISLDRNVLTSFINVGSFSGLQSIGNQLIVDEDILSKNLIRLNSNSPIV